MSNRMVRPGTSLRPTRTQTAQRLQGNAPVQPSIPPQAQSLPSPLPSSFNNENVVTSTQQYAQGGNTTPQRLPVGNQAQVPSQRGPRSTAHPAQVANTTANNTTNYQSFFTNDRNNSSEDTSIPAPAPSLPAIPTPSLGLPDYTNAQQSTLTTSNHSPQPQQTVPPAQTVEQSVSNDNSEYEEFLAWKRARQQQSISANTSSPAQSLTVPPQSLDNQLASPVPVQPPELATQPAMQPQQVSPHSSNQMTHEYSTKTHAYINGGNQRQVDTGTSVSATTGNTKSSTIMQAPVITHEHEVVKQVSDDGEFTPYHYEGYNGTGYPKGLGHGPIVTRKNIKTGKLVKVTGVAWEDFPPSWQAMLDEQPYDDAGALRIFIKSTSGVSNFPYFELGSAAHASKLRNDLRKRLSMMKHTGADLSYASRPQLDAAAWK